MKRLGISLFVCAIISGMMVIGLESRAADKSCGVWIRGIVGTVELQKKGEKEWKEVELDQCVKIGDKVRTKEDGSASIDYGDDAEVRINALTVMEVSNENNAATPNQGLVTAGEAWANVTKKNSRFTIKTPTAVAGVRGTEFDVTVDEEGNSDVNVLDGEVSIRNGYGEVLAKTGMMSRIMRHRRPDAPKKFEMAAFRKRLGGWKGRITRGRIIRMMKKKQMKQKIEEKKEQIQQKKEEKQEQKQELKEEKKQEFQEKMEQRRERMQEIRERRRNRLGR